ncbi:E3 ubiquitin-protein ligase RNF14-like isoform X2 [Channa argus]|uniref:E3 ubiquitin-protein ligase RNF14-like isoform X2 n=1 Tax=Channa argus TaxID=215402 RepID=UPI00351FEBDC
MNADTEEQEDELVALQSIFDSEEFVRNESKSGGEIRVSAELPAGFTVVLREGETVRQYEISFLPPLLLNFELPENYPSSSPPSFTLTCSWLTHTQVISRSHWSHLQPPVCVTDCTGSTEVTSVCWFFLPQLSALAAQLTDLYQASGGTVVLFSWAQFLREDALKFLNIHNLLELPSDQHNSQDTQSAALCEPKILADGQNASTSDWSRQSNLTSHHSKVSQNAFDSGPNIDVRETEQAFQTSEFKDDYQNDLFSGADKSKCERGQEDKNEDGLSVPSSLDPLDQPGQGATSPAACPRETPQNKEHRPSGLTPSQSLLSQILIFDADQKQKVFANTVFDCSVCFMSLLGSECVQLLDCGHIFCQACLAEFCKVQIKEGTVRGVTCPQADCTASPTPAQVRSLVGEELFSRYDRLLLQSTLDSMSDVVYCPRRFCGSAVFLEKSSTAALCSVCSFAFCVACRKTYHGPDDCTKKKAHRENDAQEVCANLPQSYEGMKALMDDYKNGSKERRRLLDNRYGRRVMLFTVEECLSDQWLTSNSKSCPHCFCKIEKNGGCDIMTCSRCRQSFCWACLSRLSSVRAGEHFESRSCPSCYFY